MEQLSMELDLGGGRLWPEPRLPAGYSIRGWLPGRGDGAAWCRCCLEGALGVSEASDAEFARRMLNDPSVEPANVLLLFGPDGEAAGTVTIQTPPDRPDSLLLHMVAIAPRYRGRGLSLPLNASALERMLTGSYVEPRSAAASDPPLRVRLTTDDWRLPAIRCYLRLGFQPVIRSGDAGMQGRWDAVFSRLDAGSTAKGAGRGRG